MKTIILTAIFLLSLYTISIAQNSIIVGDTLSSDIIYHNIKDTTTQNVGTPGTTTYNILDLENDGASDIEFSISMISSPSFYSITKSIKALSNIEFAMYSPASSVYWMQLFSFNSTLDTSGIWLSGALKRTLYSTTTSISGGGHSGLFNGLDDYLGFRKITNTDTVYGWILLNMQSAITIKSFAYQNKFFAGTFEEMSQANQIIYYPNPTNGLITGYLKLNSKEKTNIEVTNMMGQIILNESTSDQKITLNLQGFTNGIYFIKTTNKDKTNVKKVVLQN